MKYLSTGELKSIARDKMLGNYGTAIGAFLFMRIIIVVGLSLALSMTMATGFGAVIISFIFMLIEGVLAFGELAIYLKISVGQKTAVGDMFASTRGFGEKAVKFRLIYLAILYGSVLAGNLLQALLVKLGMASVGAILAVWGIVAVVCIYLLLVYSQVMYYLHDFADISVKEACIRSSNLMKGNKLTLLFLYISFIPMYILGALTMMIGLYYVHPYVKMTLTEFYLDRVRQMQGIDVTV